MRVAGWLLALAVLSLCGLAAVVVFACVCAVWAGLWLWGVILNAVAAVVAGMGRSRDA